MVLPDINITVPIENLNRRFDFMLEVEGNNFKLLFDKYSTLADILDYSFNDLPIFHRLKETIRRSTVFNLTNIEHYLKYVVFNHTPSIWFQANDFELIVYFNSKFMQYLNGRFPEEVKIIMKSIHKDLDGVFWFDKSIPFWVKEEYATY